MNLRICNVHYNCIPILYPKFNHEMQTKKEKWIHLETITYLTIDINLATHTDKVSYIIELVKQC